MTIGISSPAEMIAIFGLTAAKKSGVVEFFLP
jgi:hypothetical protein